MARLTPALKGATDDTLRQLGAAVQGLPKATLKQLDAELKKPGVRLLEQLGRLAFHSAAQLR